MKATYLKFSTFNAFALTAGTDGVTFLANNAKLPF